MIFMAEAWPGSHTEPRRVQGIIGWEHQADMLEEVLTNVKEAGFVVIELVTDKDSTTNATYCKHFPEGTVTYCSNHCTKNLHKQLEKLKKNKCEVCCPL